MFCLALVNLDVPKKSMTARLGRDGAGKKQYKE